MERQEKQQKKTQDKDEKIGSGEAQLDGENNHGYYRYSLAT